MPELLPMPFSSLASGEPLQHPDLSLAEKPAATRYILRGAAVCLAPAVGTLGLALPLRPMTSHQAGGRAALWLGPDEWLILAPSAEQAGIEAGLSTALARIPHSLVDVSHRQVALALKGRLAARTLSSGCPLDLSIKAFPVGTAARTLFHKAEIVLWREAEGFHLEVWRSFAPYVAGHVAAALRGAEGLPDSALP